MEDLSSLSASLKEILVSQGSEILASTIEGYFLSTDITTKKAVCETLLDLVNGGDGEQNTARREIILKENSLTYLPHLLPLSTSFLPAQELVYSIAKWSSPREVILGLSEGIQSIVDRAEGYVVSDNEDKEQYEDDDIPVDWSKLVEEYENIIRCMILTIPRLKNSKSTPTLLSLSECISSSLPILSHQSSTSSSRTLLSRLCTLVEVIWKWVQNTVDNGGEQRAILSNILFESVTLLGHKVNAKLTERWFLKTFPKFSTMPTSKEILKDGPEGYKDGQEVLNLAWNTAKLLDFTPTDLVKKVLEPSHLSVHASLASLNFLASQLVKSEFETILPTSSPSLIDDSMPILCAALSGSSVDAGLVFTWAIVQHSIENKKFTVEYDNASMLLELLVPLTAQHPSSLMRLALFKLIGEIISLQTTPNKKIQLFKQLLEPANPFDNIRIQSLSLLRENISSKSVLSPYLIEIIFPILLEFPIDSDSNNPFNLSINELLKSFWFLWWIESLTLLWFLFNFDKENITNIQSILKNDIKFKSWINVLKNKLYEIKNYQQNNINNEFNDEIQFLIMKFEDSLNRLKGIL